MAQQELVWKIVVDPAIAAAALRTVAEEAKVSSATIEQAVRQEAAAAILLQRQRSAALIAQWKIDTRGAEAEERQRTAFALREAAQQNAAVLGLQRQRSAAIVAELKKLENYETEIRKLGIANHIADLAKFQSALSSNSVVARKAADDFLKLLNPVSNIGKESGIAAREAGKMGEVLRALGSSAVIVEGPLGGVASRLRAVGAEGTQLTGLIGGPGGVIIAALAGLTLAAGAAAVAIFEIVKEAAKTSLELQHLIEQTGLSAKTITALKFAADESGKSIEGFDRGMKIFENTVAAAAHGSDKAVQALERLGVTPKKALQDLDGALAIVFRKIYDAPPGVEKVSLATDAFGKRIGANMIPLIEAFHGNLGELIKRAEELGVTLDEKGIQSLADFERSMNSLRAQALGLERTFAAEVSPTLLEFLRNLSKLLSENKDNFRQWGTAVADTVRGLVIFNKSNFAELINEVIDYTKYLFGAYVLLRAIGFAGEKLRESGAEAGTTDPRFKTQAYDPKTGLPEGRQPGDIELNLDKDTGGRAGRGGRTRKPKDTSAEEERKAIEETAKAYREETERIKHEYELRRIDFAEYIKDERQANQTRLETILNDGKSSDQQQKDARRESQKEADRIDDEEYKGKLAALQELHARRLEVDQKDAEIRIAAIQDAEKQGTKSHADAALGQIDIEQGLLNQKRDNLREEIRLEREKSPEYERTNQQIRLLAKEQEAFDAEASRKMRDAKKQDTDDTEAILEEKLKAQRKYQAAYQLLVLSGLGLDEEMAKLHIELLRARHASTIQILQAELEEQKGQEIKRNAAKETRLKRERDDALQRAVGLKDQDTLKLEIQKKFDDDMIEEKARFDAAMGVITARGAPVARALHPDTLDSIFGPNFAGHAAAIRKQLDETGKHVSDLAVAFHALGLSIHDVLQDKIAALPALMDLVNGAIDQTIQGLAAMVSQWVLYGTIGPDAVRKVAAQVLASFAEQAAVAALYYTAQGIVDLFFDPAQAAADFTAAGIWAGIAGGSAIAGRGIAGTAFQKASPSGAIAGTAFQSATGGAQSNQGQAIMLGRQRQPVEHKVTVMITTEKGFIANTVTKELNLNHTELTLAIQRTANRV